MRKRIDDILSTATCVRLVTGMSQRYFSSWSTVRLPDEDVHTFAARNIDDSFEVVVLVVNDAGIFQWGYTGDEERTILIEAVSSEERDMLREAHSSALDIDKLFRGEKI